MSKTTRLATASLIALALPLAQATGAYGGTRPASVSVREQADGIARVLDLAAPVARDAVASAAAATSGAREAIRLRTSPDPFTRCSSETARQDAHTALDAASAELRYAVERAGNSEDVTEALHLVQLEIEALREVIASV